MDFRSDCIISSEGFDSSSSSFTKCKRFSLCVNPVEGPRISTESHGLSAMGNVIS